MSGTEHDESRDDGAPGGDDDTRDMPQGGTGGKPDGGAADDDRDSLSPEAARKLRSESRTLRQRLKDAEKELEERRSKDETETQRLNRELEGERASREQAETRARNLSVQVVAARLGVKPEATDIVAGLVDWDEVDADDDDAVEKAVKAIVRKRPFLSDRSDGLDGGRGRGTGSQGETDMNTIIRRAAGRT